MATKPKDPATPAPVATDPRIIEQQALNIEQRRAERQALVGMQTTSTVSQQMAFMPTTFGEALLFADRMADSNFVPAHLRGKPGDCLAVFMQAARWGMDPFAVANKSYFVNDRIAFEAQLVNAVINTSGALHGRLRYEWTSNGGADLRCTVSGYLKADPNDEKVKTQSIARITTKNSPLWKNDPEQQLGYYTARAWVRLYAPEVLLGVFTPDELDDAGPETARNITPVSDAMPRRGASIPGGAQDYQPPADAETPHDAQTGEVARDDQQASDGQTDVKSDAEIQRGIADSLIERIGRAANVIAVGNLKSSAPSSLPEELMAEVEAAAEERKTFLRSQQQ